MCKARSWRRARSTGSSLVSEISDQHADVLRAAASDPFWRWTPTAAQARIVAEILSGKDRRHVLLGGNRSGKSEVGAYCFSAIARLKDQLPWKSTKPWDTAWVVSPTKELAGEIAWKEKLSSLFGNFYRPTDIAWASKVEQHPKSVRLHNGVQVVFKSSDQERIAFQGKSIGLVWIDEQCAKNVLDEILMRLVDTSGMLLYTNTPLHYDPDLERRHRTQDTGWRWHELDIEDNRMSRGGHLPDIEVDRILAELQEHSPDLFETRKRGAFASLQGAVFPMWRPAEHVIEHEAAMAEVDGADRIICGVDFGASAPVCCLWVAIKGEQWTVFAEHYEAGRTIDYHADQIVATNRRYDVHPRQYWCDPADTSAVEDDIKRSGRKVLQNHGLPVMTARKDWWPTVESVRKLLARPVLLDSSEQITYGTPRLRISRACSNLIRELPTYRFKAEPSARGGKPVQSKQAEGAVKRDDHSVDALRYVVHSGLMAEAETPIAAPKRAPMVYGAGGRKMAFGRTK